MYPLTIGLVIGAKPLWDSVQECLRELPVRVVFEQAEVPDWTDLVEKIEQARPDLVVVDLGLVQGELEPAFSPIKAIAQPPTICALHSEATPDLILEAMRGGASEFLYPPFDVTLTRALTRISDERQQQQRTGMRRGGKVLGFLSAKGGCGATTIACHLGLELPRQTNSHALLAEFDLEAGILGFLMKTRSDYSLLDAARNLRRLDINFWKKIVSNGNPGLEVITAPLAPAAGELLGPESLKSILSFARAHYDWTLVDLGRGLTESTLSILESVDEAFLITTMEIPALHQAKTITQRLFDVGFSREKLRLIVNRMTRSAELTIEELEKAIGHQVFATAPDDYASLHDSFTEGKLLEKDAPMRRQLAVVARRIAGIPEEKPKKRFSLFG